MFSFLLQLSISMKFFAELQKYGADEVSCETYLFSLNPFATTRFQVQDKKSDCKRALFGTTV